MGMLVIFGIFATIIIGIAFVGERVHEYWHQCNIFGKIGIILMAIFGIGGLIIMGCGFLFGLFIGCLIDLKKYLIKKEYRG